MTETIIPVSSVVFRDDLYPRLKADPATIQRYAEDLSVLPPIEVNQHYELIDGFHRWTAHKKVNASDIRVIVTETKSDIELLALATLRNSTHGLQLNADDKRKMAIRLYASGTGLSKDEIARTISASERSVNSYLMDIDRMLKEDRKQKIFQMWMSCYTQDEIANAVGVQKMTISREIEECNILEKFPKSYILDANHESDFEPPLYNIWSFGSKSNSVGHFGNTEATIVDNLLYMFTEPFSIVVDPCAGGGSTIDVCQKRLRRFWVSDRLPIVERENEIRQYDIQQGAPPLHKRWQDVSLVYLDPPYWRQAAGQYSQDADDLANMELDAFYGVLTDFIHDCGSKMRSGSHIALIIQPTQWLSENRAYTDHVFDLIASVRLPYKQRIICPYQTQQYNPQQVNWAKEKKQVLTLNRELIIWEVK